ncbi:MAG: hypothetical protein MO846_09405 [Candidatus Devosia symbiotica]|nr:hypothetical protein [Candidatus Devosia symbiotica]
MPFFLGAFATPNVAASSVTDLAGKSVGVTSGTLEDLELADDGLEGIEIIRFGDNRYAILHKKLGGQLNGLSEKWLGQELSPLPSL